MGLPIAVKTLIRQLQQLPPNAKVMFLNTDDPDCPAVAVEAAETVEEFEKSLGHPDAAKTVREAGLKHGQVVIQGS